MHSHRVLVAGFSFFMCAFSYSADDSVEKATRLIQQGQPTEAVRLLEPLALGGNSAAQYQLGMLLYNGTGAPENEQRAVELLTRSAEQGNSDAMYQLGNAFTFGNDTPKLVADADVEAAKWYYRAASLGNADAQYSLGLMFMAGKGVEKNDKEAAFWMQKAAKAGHKDAKNYVSTKK